MIISDSHRLAFIHVPKCAGTTIRASLKPIDSLGSRFDGCFDYPEGGRVGLHHIPLIYLRKYFPACYEKVDSYDSYAILRDPHARFASALFEHLRSIQHLDLSSVSSLLLRERALGICRRLEQPAERRALDLTFFVPQAAFVAIDNRQVVRHLYRIEDLSRFALDFKQRHNVVVDVGVRHNETRLPSSPAIAALQKLSGAALRRLIGAGGFARLRSGVRRSSGLTPRVLYRQLFEDARITRFVDTYYAEDRTRYEALGSTARVAEARHGWG